MPSRTAFLALLGALLLAPGSGSPQVAPPPGATLKAALESAERGLFDASQYPGLSADPAYGWLEYAVLVRSIDTLPLPAFRDNVALASVSIAPDSDGVVRLHYAVSETRRGQKK